MNIYTRQIMELLDIELPMALMVQEIMERSDLDFSECTDHQFRRCAAEAYNIYMNEEETY